MINQSLPNKLRKAYAGIRFVWADERNFRVHAGLGLSTLFAFALIRTAALWRALIALCVALVLAAELLNSAIEALTDHLHPALHPVVGTVKDMLAGMVLVVAAGAAIVAMIALIATLVG